ncbi:CD59 glycoprotein [Eublepharis macularius]|uniref:CD59 glycoprotein n=1 Tax=Eublepharis macularius TaxID=481883 RepID=A0AA97IX28_EUBMA|nr:CD59 glycoprotein [Eublepharis macularius]
MKCLLITVAFVALFYCSESVLQCYECNQGPDPCKTPKNCSSEYDTCLWVKLGEQTNVYSCWKKSTCDVKDIEAHFHIGTFKYKCCNKNLCNSSPTTMAGSIITLGIASVLTASTLLFR